MKNAFATMVLVMLAACATPVADSVPAETVATVEQATGPKFAVDNEINVTFPNGEVVEATVVEVTGISEYEMPDGSMGSSQSYTVLIIKPIDIGEGEVRIFRMVITGVPEFVITTRN